jgi:Icc-related predicted phosphoesterase
MKIIALADIHGRLDHLPRIGNEIASADLVLLAGDITQFGVAESASRVLEAFRVFNRRILAVAGNIDRPQAARFLEDEGISLHGRGKKVGDVGLFGAGGSNLTPLGTPNEMADEDMLDVLERGRAEIRDAAVKILVTHAPPRKTKVDRMFLGLHVGSGTLRAFIERAQPDLCLCGHIHEARGTDVIGRTRILNPGPFFKGGFARVEIDDGGIRAELASAV